ncbi:RHE_PE00001 family protein [Roseibium sp. FZY0029]|uniref:RHE_PE00001 family protein n=1 Tax=Roseibium sp. FZY0029 TaxID=3116647 RepID=UPI002EA09B00|nr:RHE_PE00001 family protein [Roseibium sp. FZY0029]
MGYDLRKSLKSLDWFDLAGTLDSASRVLTRSDERLRRTPTLEDGVRRRSHLFDTCASIALNGDLVHLEDLVLHDAGTDRRAPTHELTRAARLLSLRRRIDRQPPEAVLSRTGVLTLIGQQADLAFSDDTQDHRQEQGRGGVLSAAQYLDDAEAEEALLAEIDAVLERSRHLADGTILPRRITSVLSTSAQLARISETPDRDDRLDSWFASLNEADALNLPPVLTAALLLDAWHVLQPLDNWPELGRLLPAVFLKAHVTPSHLPILSAGLRKSPFRWRRKDPLQTRIAGLLLGFEKAALETLDQLDRLSIAQEQLARHCQSCRSHSRLPEFAQMFLSRPLVTIPMARQTLGVTAAAVDRMIRQLGPALPRELTGRDRYRAWGIL